MTSGSWRRGTADGCGYRPALSDRTQHLHQHGVNVIGPFDVFVGEHVGENPRSEQYRSVLPAAQPSVGADEWFEGGDVEGDVVDAAVEIEVRGLRHHHGTPEHPGSMVSVQPEGILTGDLAGVETVAAARTDGPRHDLRRPDRR